jgi:hypothetical protein
MDVEAEILNAWSSLQRVRFALGESGVDMRVALFEIRDMAEELLA